VRVIAASMLQVMKKSKVGSSLKDKNGKTSGSSLETLAEGSKPPPLGKEGSKPPPLGKEGSKPPPLGKAPGSTQWHVTSRSSP
jgi:hypothetical protein